MIRFNPAIKLVNDHFGKVNGDGIHRLRLRQNGMVDFSKVTGPYIAFSKKKKTKSFA